MKQIYLLSLLLLLICGCKEEEDYGPSHGVEAPNLSIILNDQSGKSLLPELPENYEGILLKSEHEVTYEANGMECTIEEDENFRNCLIVEKLELIEGKPLALRPLPYNFGYKLVEVAKGTSDYKCHAKVSLKCPDIFRDENEHVIEMDLEYCGDKRYEILQVVKGTLQVDGITAECIDYKVYKVNLNIK